MFKSGSSKKANGTTKSSSKKTNGTTKSSTNKKSDTPKKGNQGSFVKASTAIMKKKFGPDTKVIFKSPRNTFDISRYQPSIEQQIYNYALSKQCEK